MSLSAELQAQEGWGFSAGDLSTSSFDCAFACVSVCALIGVCIYGCLYVIMRQIYMRENVKIITMLAGKRLGRSF